MKKTIYFLVLLLFSGATGIGAKNQVNLSVYDYLKSDGRFNVTVRLIDDLNYKESLSSTGLATLLVAKDSAFIAFFTNNPWHVSTYEQLTVSQKKYLLKFSLFHVANSLSTIDNFYLNGIVQNNKAIRKPNSLEVLDSVPYLSGTQLPTSKYWNSYRLSGMYQLPDITAMSTVFFNQNFIDKYGLTPEDAKLILGVDAYSHNDFHFFNNRVINGDIACTNGYIHVLKNVLLPPQNMADFISSNTEGDSAKTTRIFSKLLDRFCAPFYDYSRTAAFHVLHPEFTDSIFRKYYFSVNGGMIPILNSQVFQYPLLYSPAWNNYTASSSYPELDMAAMFVPSDKAMTNYMNSNDGLVLKRRFGSWDSVPDEIVVSFINRIMRKSFLESLPGNFSKMKDADSYPLPVNKSDIVSTYTALNGEVYITNKVYPPIALSTAYSPVSISNDTKIMNWAINITQQGSNGTSFAFYRLYLNSLMCKYGLFIPTDTYFNKYIDPIAYGQTVNAVLKYKYNTATSSVNAVVYQYNASTGVVGDSVAIITSSTFLQNRLWDLLNSHIVKGDVQSGKQYYITRGNDIVKVTGSGSVTSVQGGGDVAAGTTCNVTQTFNGENGHTYFLDKPIQPALQSVYKVLSTTPQFSEFFNLLSQAGDSIFTVQGVDQRVRFFNGFNYTIYVPTNSAIQQAINNGTILTWDQIALLSGQAKIDATHKLIRMLRYHFQDNALFFGQTVNDRYTSATIKEDALDTYWHTVRNKFFKIGVQGSAGAMTLTMDSKVGDTRTANVVTSNGLYNIIAKDYLFAKAPSSYKNVDGTGSQVGALFNTSTITTSSSAVIHQIDNVLTFE